jgi:hypothetical protein
MKERCAWFIEANAFIDEVRKHILLAAVVRYSRLDFRRRRKPFLLP